MATKTTRRYGFYLPNFNEAPWHDYMNGNMSRLDTLLYSMFNSQVVDGEWEPDTEYDAAARVFDPVAEALFSCLVAHTSGSTTFADDRVAHPTYWARVSPGIVPRGSWTTLTAYRVQDMVSESGNVYMCEENHTSDDFAEDLAADKWSLYVERGAAGDGAGDVTGPVSSVDNQVVLFSGGSGKAIKSSSILISELAPKANPTFTGTVTVPDQGSGDNTTKAANTKFVTAAVSTLSGTIAATLASKLGPENIGVSVQGYNADLAAIAALAPANDTVLQRKGGAWEARSPSQLSNDLSGFLAGYELIDTLATTSGATQALVGISSVYKHLLFLIDGVSHNHTSDAGLRLELSTDNGSSYGSSIILIASSGNDSAKIWYGTCLLFRTGISGKTKNGNASWISGTGNGNSAPCDIATTGIVNAVRFGVSGGAFDAGSIGIYGVR